MGSWGTVVEALAAEHTVLLLNLPGSGGSPLPDVALQIDVIADQVVATAQKAGLESFAVAGASLGAAVAIKVAARHPERVLAGRFTQSRPRQPACALGHL
jgi:pimeloyl-ACP methyl ester carboxylesterase